MTAVRRATIYFQADVHRALHLKAAAAGKSISDIVNEALRQPLAEDVEDLDAAAKRRAEKSIALEQFMKSVRRRAPRAAAH